MQKQKTATCMNASRASFGSYALRLLEVPLKLEASRHCALYPDSAKNAMSIFLILTPATILAAIMERPRKQTPSPSPYRKRNSRAFY